MNDQPEITEEQLILDKIYEYFTELGYNDIIIYGSFIERMNGFEVVPNDIDVTLVIDEEPPEKRHKTFYLGFSELPINVEIMHRSSFKAELNSMQPKYFMCIANPAIQKDIDVALLGKLPHEVRACISSITSKAFDKGRKKLIVENDYDEVLGLKNLYHAFKFPYYAWWFYGEVPEYAKAHDIAELNVIHSDIYETYRNSTGTLEERCQALMAVVKPQHNALMTEFRIIFPKEV